MQNRFGAQARIILFGATIKGQEYQQCSGSHASVVPGIKSSMLESQMEYITYLILSWKWRADSDDYLQTMHSHIVVRAEASIFMLSTVEADPATWAY